MSQASAGLCHRPRELRDVQLNPVNPPYCVVVRGAGGFGQTDCDGCAVCCGGGVWFGDGHADWDCGGRLPRRGAVAAMAMARLAGRRRLVSMRGPTLILLAQAQPVFGPRAFGLGLGFGFGLSASAVAGRAPAPPRRRRPVREVADSPSPDPAGTPVVVPGTPPGNTASRSPLSFFLVSNMSLLTSSVGSN